jgi:ribonuclease HI
MNDSVFNSNTIALIPFGKYRNITLTDIYSKDKKYLIWLNTQPWFQIKFTDIHKSLIQLLDENKEKIEINRDTVVIYTDGACKNNGSKNKVVSAGVGIHFSYNNHIKMTDISMKLDIDTPTNNKAELIAILFALQECHKNNITDKIIIYTDSQYCIDAITKWYDQWLNDGTIHNKKNVSFIQPIKSIMKMLNVSFIHVRAHSKKQDIRSLGNEIADQLATRCL